MDAPFGVILGTGARAVLCLGGEQTQVVETSAGPAQLLMGYVSHTDVVCALRHGAGHAVPPHRINHAANVLALRDAGVQYCLSTSAVGTLRADWPPKTVAVLSDFLDFTRRGPVTLFSEEVQHTDFSEPFSCTLRDLAIESATELGLHPKSEAVYVCADGPRYETPAEVRLYRQLGGDIVGMTVAPEAILAREAGIAYASIAVVTNYGTGLAPEALAHDHVQDVMNAMAPSLAAIFQSVMNAISKRN